MGNAKCQSQEGFLFSHGCSLPATGFCVGCGIRVCDEHLFVSEDGPYCVRCHRSRNPEASDPEDEPYYYDGYYTNYNSGVEVDRDDFTEADGLALGEAGSLGFEDELDAS